MMEDDCHVTVLKPSDDQRTNFQVVRRLDADRSAQSDVYVCSDDDCFPEHEPFVKKAREIMEEYPQFGIISLWPNNSTLNRWTPEPEEAARVCVDGNVFEDDKVMEHVSVGGIRFCRQGILKEWPELVGKTYDSQHCQALRDAGYRSGYFKDIKFNHLGRGYSTVWEA